MIKSCRLFSDWQLQSCHGNQKKFSSSRQVVIKPKQDFPVDIVFNPSKLSSFKGTLDVKPINGSTKYLVCIHDKSSFFVHIRACYSPGAVPINNFLKHVLHFSLF